MNRGLDTADGNFPHVSVTAKKKDPWLSRPRGHKKGAEGSDARWTGHGCTGKPTTRDVSSTKINRNTRARRESGGGRGRGSRSPRRDSHPSPSPNKSKPSFPESTPPTSATNAATDPTQHHRRGLSQAPSNGARSRAADARFSSLPSWAGCPSSSSSGES
jgi:hypothetical protein